MLFVDLWQSPILVFTNYETCLIDCKIILYRLADIETWHNDFKNLARREGIEPPFYA